MSEIVVYMTAKNRDEAKKIAAALLEKKLIACANIIEGAISMYEWKGELCEEIEVVVIMKSRKELFEELKSTVLSLHSYEVPALVGIKIDAGHEPFLAWIRSQTKL